MSLIWRLSCTGFLLSPADAVWYLWTVAAEKFGGSLELNSLKLGSNPFIPVLSWPLIWLSMVLDDLELTPWFIMIYCIWAFAMGFSLFVLLLIYGVLYTWTFPSMISFLAKLIL